MESQSLDYTIEFSVAGELKIAEALSDTIIIRNLDDAIDLLGNCSYQGASRIILHERNLVPEFFDLKTQLAGEILQKFSNYRMQLAIVGDFSRYISKSLKDFIYESNQGRLIRFVLTVDDARAF
jgi:hypothetical protein